MPSQLITKSPTCSKPTDSPRDFSTRDLIVVHREKVTVLTSLATRNSLGRWVGVWSSSQLGLPTTTGRVVRRARHDIVRPAAWSHYADG